MRVSAQVYAAAAVGQPGAHLSVINGVKCIEYTTALEWSLNVGTTAGFADKLFWKTRPNPLMWIAAWTSL
jgi:hypothetical protein